MILIGILSNYFSVALFVLLATLYYLKHRKSKVNRNRNDPPSPPFKLPIVGHMLSLVKYSEDPWEGFDSFRKKYGNVVYLRLGAYDFVLISSSKLIKEVLITKQDQFANRPHFERYKCIFGGNQENALAMCDWSELQRQRRNMIQVCTIPRYGSKLFLILDKCINEEILVLNDKLNDQRDVIKLSKLDILVFAFNIFTNYLCSQRFDYDDQNVRKQIKSYDFIFWDITQGYPFDFLPFLNRFGFVKKQLNDLRELCDEVRNFVEVEMVLPRHNELKNQQNIEAEPLENCKDFLEFNLKTHYADPVGYDWESSIYQIGDLIGGNSAVANILYRLLGHLALNPQCQDRCHEESKQALEHLNTLNNEDEETIRLKHRSLMVYTEACMMETLRLGSSPIVPHVAMEDSTIGGYHVGKNTYAMINNYNLNMSEEYHFEPKTFEPTRFLAPRNGTTSETTPIKSPLIRSYRPIEFLKYQVHKPEYYFPFSFGKRSCLGYKLTQTITFSTVANLMLQYSIRPLQGGYAGLESQLKPNGCIALKVEDCFDLILMPRV